jgi:hypothetical protein
MKEGERRKARDSVGGRVNKRSKKSKQTNKGNNNNNNNKKAARL